VGSGLQRGAKDPLTPSSQADFTQKNRLSGVAYDGNGNQTQVNPYTLSYDGENQVSDVFSAMNGSARYDYSGDGRRVQKVVGNAVTQYVYDAMGELAAEYTYGAAPPNSPQGDVHDVFPVCGPVGEHTGGVERERGEGDV